MPMSCEVDYVAAEIKAGRVSQMTKKVALQDELKDLHDLKAKVRDPAKIVEMEKLVEKMGSGIALNQQEKERVQEILKVTENSPRLR